MIGAATPDTDVAELEVVSGVVVALAQMPNRAPPVYPFNEVIEFNTAVWCLI